VTLVPGPDSAPGVEDNASAGTDSSADAAAASEESEAAGPQPSDNIDNAKGIRGPKPGLGVPTSPAPAPFDKKERKKRQRPTIDVAVYSVFVDAAGNIRDVVLTHSCGIPSFDEAGKKMIYDGLATLASSPETGTLKVTLHFSQGRR
jgi:hypothetical protein